jgi:hypothetical protein
VFADQSITPNRAVRKGAENGPNCRHRSEPFFHRAKSSFCAGRIAKNCYSLLSVTAIQRVAGVMQANSYTLEESTYPPAGGLPFDRVLQSPDSLRYSILFSRVASRRRSIMDEREMIQLRLIQQ